MRLFGRKQQEPAPPRASPATEPSRFTTAAAADGFTPLTDADFTSDMHELARATMSVLSGQTPYRRDEYQPVRAHFQDAYRDERDGRTVMVANALANIPVGLPGRAVREVSACVVEIPALIGLVCIQPRRLPFRVVQMMPERATGDAAFDERFMVQGAPGLPPVDISADMRGLISARDDWLFVVQEYHFICLAKERFESVDDMLRRIDEVLAVVAALPSSLVPSRVDHSQDDLVARIAKLDTIEDAIAFLQQLTPAEREQLASSDTPLARFADVTTPEEAFARFESLDMATRLQVLAMFERVQGGA